MTRILLLCVLVFSTALSAPGCKKASQDQASDGKGKTSPGKPSASRPITDSGEIIATVQLPTGVQMADLAKAIDNIQPGASGMMAAAIPMGLAQATGMELSAVDLNAPISILVLNPKNHPKPAALLVKAKDAKALKKAAEGAGLVVVTKKGLSLIGEAAVVEATQKAAFDALATPSSKMLLRVYPGTLLKLFKDDLHAAIQKAAGLMAQQPNGGSGFKSIMLAYEDMLVAIGDQTEYIDITVGSGDGASDLFLRLQPRAGTTMAALAEAQVPSKHELLAKLPADTAGTMLFAGDMRAGAARKPMVDFAMKMMSAIMPAQGNDELAAMLATWFEAFDGRVAMSMVMDMSNLQAPKFNATYLMGSTDAVAMRKGWRDMMGLMVARATKGSVDMMGMKFDIAFKEKALEVDGVEVDRYHSKMNIEGMAEEMRTAMTAAQMDQVMHFATFDDVAVMAMSPDSAKTIATSISAARGKSPGLVPSGSQAIALKRSAALKESMFFSMDMSKLMPAGAPPIPFSMVTMGFGQDAGALSVRMSIRK